MENVLVIDLEPESPGARLTRAGMRRHARACGWNLVELSREGFYGPAMADALARYRPVGGIVNDNQGDGYWHGRLPAGFPVVFLDSVCDRDRRDGPSVVCDNEAVARAAFEELQAGLPESFAFATSESVRSWNAERLATFRRLCAGVSRPCRVFPGRPGESRPERLARLRAWVARLPVRCAVFAANDNCACDVADAFAAAGRSLPRDNMIVGADGGKTSSNGGNVSAISSVKIDFELSGFLAARLLSEILSDGSGSGGSPPRTIRSVMFGPLMVLRRESTRGHGRREPRILEAVEMIRREACEGLSAAALAARFPGSRNLFERRFREAMGHSVLDEILHVRLQRVLDLLSRPDMPISAIAAFSGFSSDRELRQLFLRRFRCSMRQWRVRHSPRAR